MEKIRIEKFITQYEKNKVIKTERVDLYYAPDGATAKKIIENTELHFVKNIKDISLFESIKAYVPTNTGIKVYFKEIDFNTLKTWTVL